ncbi:MAG: polyprenyl synthetase family protein [Candidatus Omnitrophica bacterium]|nr:polyprenyl synthetase family protein [Candidatus Omnitrophota bacterium]
MIISYASAVSKDIIIFCSYKYSWLNHFIVYVIISPMLDPIRNKIEHSIKQFVVKRLKFYQVQAIHPFFYEQLLEYTLRKGKRIRPMLLVLAYDGYRKTKNTLPPSLYNAASSIELLHNFMLIHDDIIDCSDLRRGKPTLHKLLEKTTPCSEPEKLGISLGIIAGDLLYTLAIEALLSVNEKPKHKQTALQYFTQTTAYTAIGEFVDTVYGFEPLDAITEKGVYLNYTLKTSRYTFEGPLIIGATLAGANQTEIKNCSKLSILAGQAFQIQDDVIGIFGTEEAIGKSILSDLEESKKTLLVCHAFHHLKGTDKKQFLSVFTKKTKTLADLEIIKALFLKTGSLQYCLKETRKRVDQAVALLQKSKMKPAIRAQIQEVISAPFKASAQIAEQYNLKF